MKATLILVRYRDGEYQVFEYDPHQVEDARQQWKQVKEEYERGVYVDVWLTTIDREMHGLIIR